MKGITTITVFAIILLCLPGFVTGQPTSEHMRYNEIYRTALELFNKDKFGAALREFNKLQTSLEPSSVLYEEILFYKAICSMETGKEEGKMELENFIKSYKNSVHDTSALLWLGNDDFENGHYESALSHYTKIDKHNLPYNKLDEFLFKTGYCYFIIENYDKSKPYLYELDKTSNPYSWLVHYYLAHINYIEGNYETAIAKMNKVHENDQLANIIPLYKVHIHFLQKRYADVVKEAPPLLESVSTENRAEMSKIIGSSHYYLKNYEDAIPFLEKYHQKESIPDTKDNYILGICYHMSGHNKKAVKYLQKATENKDEITQNAYYHLADAYLKEGEKQKAMTAFSSASELGFDDKIKEDALFQYAKITYELNYSPFNEAINAFDKYISLYPDSERSGDAYDYLVKVFMSTNNYKDALTSLDKIKIKNPAIQKAYQRVAYHRALELLKDRQYEDAISLFYKSLEYKQYNNDLEALTYYWRGEVFFRQEKLDDALADYRKFQNVPGSFNLEEYAVSNYNIGYIYFDRGEFESAATWFRRFINASHSADPQYISDTHNRIGDCNYMQRNFNDAISSYNKAYELDGHDADYALYRIAFCEGLLGNHGQKIDLAIKLQKQFPESSYTDDVMFELGRTYGEIGNYGKAIENYNNLLEMSPASPYAPESLLQLGLIHYNQDKYTESLRYFKQVVEKHPLSRESKDAIKGVENSYMEMGMLENYFLYISGLEGVSQPSISKQDSLTYFVAEKLYMEKNNTAIDKLSQYLEQFPNGRFALNANFYKAERHHNNGEMKKAIKGYEFVLSQPDNIFTEVALLKTANIVFKEKEYARALSLFERLENITNNSKNRLIALEGQLHCNYELKNFEKVTHISWQLRNTEKVPEELVRDAQFLAAKSYTELNQPEKAFPIWTELAKDAKTSEGAEAKYRICKYYFDNNQLEKAEKTINSFIEINTPHQHWLAKSLILQAKVCIKKNNHFEAVHTLKSVIENYKNNKDGIIDEINELLNELDSVEEMESNTVHG